MRKCGGDWACLTNYKLQNLRNVTKPNPSMERTKKATGSGMRFLDQSAFFAAHFRRYIFLSGSGENGCENRKFGAVRLR